MYNDEFKNYDHQYHYTRGDDLPRDDYQSTYARPADEPKSGPKKGRRVLKIAALILAGIVLAGACGFGGAKLAAAMPRSKAVLQESTRQAVEVAVKKVDGKTLMTPAEVYASTVNSVVSINSSSTSYNVFGQRSESLSSGTGFIITADGYIVTNQHVVKDASSVKVTLYDGTEYNASVIGGDSDYDVAVLKISAEDLTPVVLGRSDTLNVGDTVLAIGNPLGELTFSMSQGIVSCCDRAINVDGTPFNMIQVDCSINSGNSGGPLMNLYGEVVGIVSAKYSSDSNTSIEGLGFALPMNDVQAILTDIMEEGSVTDKAYLAITAGTMTEQMAAQYKIDLTSGVFVYSVEKGGAGDKAGLRLGDVITKLNNTPIASMQDLTVAKKGYRAGDTVTLTVYRDGGYITTELTFDVQPQTTGDTEVQQPQNDNGGNYYGGNGPFSYGDLFDYFFGNRGFGNGGF